MTPANISCKHPRMDMSDLPPPLQNLPAEVLVDARNPANDPYFDSLRRSQQFIIRKSQKMRQRAVHIAKLYHSGLTRAKIAEKLECSYGTVAQTLIRPDTQELLHLLQHHAHLVEGPNLELRKNMLWRIASHNENDEPNVAINAIKELNKLEGAYPQPDSHSPSINITLNGDLMPRTQLDQ